MSILLIATVLSTQIPETAIDRTWGQLMRAEHHAGRWSVEVDGKRFIGDWVIVDRDANAYTPRGGHGARIHLVSTTDATYCSITLGGQQMFCDTDPASNAFYNLHLAHEPQPGVGSVAVQRYNCVHGSCKAVRAGSLGWKLQRARPTLAQAQTVFATLHRSTLATTLGATVMPGAGLVLRMPYRIVTDRATQGAHVRDVIVVDATVVLTTDPKPTITTRETDRYVEDCEYRANAHLSCHPQPPTCKRR